MLFQAVMRGKNGKQPSQLESWSSVFWSAGFRSLYLHSCDHLLLKYSYQVGKLGIQYAKWRKSLSKNSLYNITFAYFLRNPFRCFFHNCIVDWVSSLTLWLGYANSMLNPIIYGVLHRDFRKTFIEILSCHMMREYFRAYNSKYWLLEIRKYISELK